MKFMKKLHLLCIFLLTFFFGCEKSNSDPLVTNIAGKWVYIEYYFNNSGPGVWNEAFPSDQTIEFKDDGYFSSDDSFLKGLNKFEVLDSANIRFRPAPTADGYLWMKYKINTIERTLILTPINTYCVEGCGYKFRR